jgi:hypothetical protein
MGTGRRLVAVGWLIAAMTFGGCGTESERFSDNKIIDALGLEELDSNYAIGGDPFCLVETELFNDGDEVQSALDSPQSDLVLSSREGGVGIQAVPPFAPDCKRKAKDTLNKLDPVPKDD